MTIKINANQHPIGQTVTCQTMLWYLENNGHILKYNPVQIDPLRYGQGNRLGGVSVGINQVKDPEHLPLYEVPTCGNFAGLLLYVGDNYTNFGYKGSNTTGDGTNAVFYDANQNFIRSDYIPTPPISPDQRYHYSGNFPINNDVKFILFGAYDDTAFEIEEITLE